MAQENIKPRLKIAVIGSGSAGCKIASDQASRGQNVHLFEAGVQISPELSWKWGARNHSGAHSPLSRATRELCYQSSIEYHQLHSGLVIDGIPAIYALAKQDGGHDQTITPAMLESICKSIPGSQCLSPASFGLQNVSAAYMFPEQGLANGQYQSDYWKQELERSGVRVFLESGVTRICRHGDKFNLTTTRGNSDHYDIAINATGYSSLSANHELFNAAVVYQVCWGFLYTPKQHLSEPLSLTVLYGQFLSLLPIYDSGGSSPTKYVLTHVSDTKSDQMSNYDQAKKLLDEINHKSLISKALLDKTRKSSERDCKHFYPAFDERFEYQSWQASIHPKLRSTSDFRNVLVFRPDDDIIYVFPGKVSQVVTAAQEVNALVRDLVSRRETEVTGGIAPDLENPTRFSPVMHREGLTFSRTSGFATSWEEIFSFEDTAVRPGNDA
ncbi:hypothetical protein BO78DRAFT_437265 [Aspergillus sclerotiicarbonarius CBS 121057]|uniref:FAD dependent oxidoreductase domain-containing protein n=1 Tax=Aspergillus sclerotiicarbonarius (strain CBS 121057 / IBT 28362) TaxID=1448318 RepID=A0A319EIQ1_ASPSB|nr:hypothetical protein BO78DRAFT_437265 [Aspergillus sclerotiicarbonarius CBS 121057]